MRSNRKTERWNLFEMYCLEAWALSIDSWKQIKQSANFGSLGDQQPNPSFKLANFIWQGKMFSEFQGRNGRKKMKIKRVKRHQIYPWLQNMTIMLEVGKNNWEITNQNIIVIFLEWVRLFLGTFQYF